MKNGKSVAGLGWLIGSLRDVSLSVQPYRKRFSLQRFDTSDRIDFA